MAVILSPFSALQKVLKSENLALKSGWSSFYIVDPNVCKTVNRTKRSGFFGLSKQSVKESFWLIFANFKDCGNYCELLPYGNIEKVSRFAGLLSSAGTNVILCSDSGGPQYYHEGSGVLWGEHSLDKLIKNGWD